MGRSTVWHTILTSFLVRVRARVCRTKDSGCCLEVHTDASIFECPVGYESSSKCDEEIRLFAPSCSDKVSAEPQASQAWYLKPLRSSDSVAESMAFEKCRSPSINQYRPSNHYVIKVRQHPRPFMYGIGLDPMKTQFPCHVSLSCPFDSRPF